MNIQKCCYNDCAVKKDAEMMAEEILPCLHIKYGENKNTKYQCIYCGEITIDILNIQHKPKCIVNIANKYIGE